MATRPRFSANPSQYEDFQPSSSLSQEKDCETLTVNLPGFTKDQINVQMNDRSRTVMISGERPIGNNKWRRFRKDLQVPINCNTTEIRAKFENGILKITMPVKPVQHPIILPALAPLPVPVLPPPPPPTPPPPPSQKPVVDSKLPTGAPQPRPITKPISEPKLPKPASVAPIPIHKPAIVPILPQPFPQPPPPPILIKKPDSALKPTSTPQSRISEKLNPMSAPYHPLSPKHTTDPKHTLTDKLTQGLESLMKPKHEHGHDDHKLESSKVTEKIIDLKTSKTEHGEHKIVETEKHSAGKSENHEKFSSASRSSGVVWDDQSKQLIINMVAAVLVIMALFVHVKYTVKFPDW